MSSPANPHQKSTSIIIKGILFVNFLILNIETFSITSNLNYFHKKHVRNQGQMLLFQIEVARRLE